MASGVPKHAQPESKARPEARSPMVADLLSDDEDADRFDMDEAAEAAEEAGETVQAASVEEATPGKGKTSVAAEMGGAAAVVNEEPSVGLSAPLSEDVATN